jgi:hypothetical protein
MEGQKGKSGQVTIRGKVVPDERSFAGQKFSKDDELSHSLLRGEGPGSYPAEQQKSDHSVFLFDRGLPLVVAWFRWIYLSGSPRESEIEGGI